MGDRVASFLRRFGSVVAIAAWVACGGAQIAAQEAGGAPEPGSNHRAKTQMQAQRHMAVAAHPLAAQAGLDMLRQGGSAVDAAIAAQLVLGLVEPQSSGLGGGAFMTLALPNGRLTTYDGRETAPSSVRPDHFLGPDGKPMAFADTLPHGRAVGAPGVVAMLAQAHAAHGKLPWADLFKPAIVLAEAGVPAAPRLVGVLTEWRRFLERSPDLAKRYYRDGAGPPAIGDRLPADEMAITLRMLAVAGPDAFYRGPIGKAIIARLQEAAGPDGTPGSAPILTAEDLAAYHSKERPAICMPYRAWRICGMGPPSAGSVTVMQILGMLSHYDLAAMGKDNPRAWHLLLEASRLAHADREMHIADPDLTDVPLPGLLDPTYLAERAQLIAKDRAARGPVKPGVPPARRHARYAAGDAPDIPSTSHLTTMDATGMVVSMTTSVEFAFGSGLIAAGMPLNNQLTDFTFNPVRDGRPTLNAPGPGKRPRSSMAPMIVLDAQGKPILTLGSPGGTAIIGYVAQAMVAILDWGMEPQAALNMPSLQNRNGPTTVEKLAAADRLAEVLMAMGHEVRRDTVNSGLHAIKILPDGRILGAADPRRDGEARGD
jgi:gamma-glutamyltranspeptidase / glutathione hydrolase